MEGWHLKVSFNCLPCICIIPIKFIAADFHIEASEEGFDFHGSFWSCRNLVRQVSGFEEGNKIYYLNLLFWW